MANRNELLRSIAANIGVTAPSIQDTQNELLANIAQGLGGAGDIRLSKDQLLFEIATRLGASPSVLDNRNELLCAINTTYDDGYDCTDKNRNDLLTDFEAFS